MLAIRDLIFAFLGIVTSLVFAVLLNELPECGRWLAQRLTRWSARRLGDPREVARYEEEWLADIQRVPGKLLPLIYAIFFIVMKVPRMRRVLKPIKSEKRSPRLGLGYSVGGGLGAGVSAEMTARMNAALEHGIVIALGHSLIAGLIAGLVYGLLVGLLAGLEAGMIAGLVVGLVYALGQIVVSGLAHVLNRPISRR